MALAIHDTLGAGFLLLLGGCTLKFSSQRTTVICFAVREKDQAAVCFEAFIT